MALLTGIRAIDDLKLENEIVFVRADLDCPVTKGGGIVDDAKIQLAIPILKTLQEKGARVVVGSRFEGNRSAIKRGGALPSIEPAAARLGELCECDVLLPDSCTGDAVKKVLIDLRTTQLCVLENLAREDDQGRHAEGFARKLEKLVDVFVADSVRALAIESATTTHLPRLMDERAASPSMMRELSALERIQSGIDDPRVIVWGGNSLSTRLDLLATLAGEDAHVLLCGVAANTMLRALGGALGRSAVEEDYLAGARTLADRLGKRLLLPEDSIAADSPKATSGNIRVSKRIPADEMALDIGPTTRLRYAEIIEKSRTAIWIGTVGFHKSPAFNAGTRAICEAFARTSAFTLVAGDDSVAAARATSSDLLPRMDCVTRGGPSSLALLKDNKLPGLEALRGTS